MNSFDLVRKNDAKSLARIKLVVKVNSACTKVFVSQYNCILYSTSSLKLTNVNVEEFTITRVDSVDSLFGSQAISIKILTTHIMPSV